MLPDSEGHKRRDPGLLCSCCVPLPPQVLLNTSHTDEHTKEGREEWHDGIIKKHCGARGSFSESRGCRVSPGGDRAEPGALAPSPVPAPVLGTSVSLDKSSFFRELHFPHLGSRGLTECTDAHCRTGRSPNLKGLGYGRSLRDLSEGPHPVIPQPLCGPCGQGVRLSYPETTSTATDTLSFEGMCTNSSLPGS